MEVGSCASIAGQIRTGALDVAKLPDTTKLTVSIKLVEGNRKGKTAFITAGIHGNEINGIETLHRFLQELNADELTGTLVIVPTLNPWGFQKRMRRVPFDDNDLNRGFPGRADGTVTEQIAKAIHDEIIMRCDFGIDLHDAGARNVLLPHPRIHMIETDGCTKEMGSVFGTEIIMERAGNKGMMAVEAHRHHAIPVLTAEIGGGMVLWNDFVEEGLAGVRNILRYQGMLPGEWIVPEKQFYLSEREGYKAKMGGILERKVELGQAIRKGQQLATIYNPLDGTHEDLLANNDGVVFSIKLGATIEMGEKALSILEFNIHSGEAEPIEAEVIQNDKVTGRNVRESMIMNKLQLIAANSARAKS